MVRLIKKKKFRFGALRDGSGDLWRAQLLCEFEIVDYVMEK